MFFCLPVHFVTYARTVPFTLKSENRKKKSHTHVIPHSNKTLTSKNADQYRFKERKFTKVFMKFQELLDTVE